MAKRSVRAAVKAYFNHGGLARPYERVARRVRAADREFAGLLYSEDGVRRLDAGLERGAPGRVRANRRGRKRRRLAAG